MEIDSLLDLYNDWEIATGDDTVRKNILLTMMEVSAGRYDVENLVVAFENCVDPNKAVFNYNDNEIIVTSFVED